MPRYRFKRVPAAADLHFEDGDVRELPEAFSQFPWWIPMPEDEPTVSDVLVPDSSGEETVKLVEAEWVQVETVDEPVPETPIVEEVEEPIPEEKPKRSRRSKK